MNPDAWPRRHRSRCGVWSSEYGELTAVAGVDLTVNVGDVYGYLGPNGAGKTTSLRMMLGLIRPTAGSGAAVRPRPDAERRARSTGVAGFVEAPTFYPYLSGRRNLELLAAFDGGDARSGSSGRSTRSSSPTAPRTASAATRTGCASGSGSRRRCCATRSCCCSTSPRPGSTRRGMRDMRLLIRRLADQGMTVLLSSHLLTEVEEVCNRVAIVRSGRIVYEGEIADLKRGAGTTLPARRRPRTSARWPSAARSRGSRMSRRERRRGSRSPADEAAVAELSPGAGRGRRADPRMAPQTVTLEDLFFSLTEGDRASVPAAPEPTPAGEPATAA